MSERTSPEYTDMEVMKSRPIVSDVEKTDPPCAGFSASSRYPSLNKRKVKRPGAKKDDSYLWDVKHRKFVEPDRLPEGSSEIPDTMLPPPSPKKEGEEKENTSNKRYKMDPYELTITLMGKYSFVIIDDTLHCYDPKWGYWRCIPEKDSKDALRKMIPMELRFMVTAPILSEVYHWLMTDCRVISNDALSKRKDYLNFADVVFSIEDQKTMPHSPELYFQNVLTVNYPDSRNTDGAYYKTFLKDTFGNDEDTIRCFEEFLGLAISSVRDSKQSFFLYGPSNTGKSVILSVLERILGIEFTSSLSFSQLGNEFAVAQLVGKWLNISGEMSGIANKRIDIFKSLTGNDLVTACFKGKDHFQFHNQALLVFACNNFPEISSELVEAFSSRLFIFPFLNVVPRDKWISDLSEKLFAERDILIERAIKGLTRLRKKNFEFSETEAMRHCKDLFLGEANSFLLFSEKHLREDPNGQCASCVIIQNYQAFCKEHNLMPVADNVWSKLLQEKFSVEKCNITSGPEIENKVFKYNSRGYKGIKLVRLEELNCPQNSIA